MRIQNVFWLLWLVSMAAAQPSVELVRQREEFSGAHLEAVLLNGKPAAAVVFAGTADMHYYATPESAPAQGLELTIATQASGLSFGEPILPQPSVLFDKGLEKNIAVYVGGFEVLLPIANPPADGKLQVDAVISGVACTSEVCLAPFKKTVSAEFDFAAAAQWRKIEKAIEPPARPASGQIVEGGSFGISYALLMAVLAGLSFNLMPCVLPVLPLILSRLISQAQEKTSRRIGLGLAFCAGVIFFFAVLSGVSILIKLTTGAVFNWGDHLRYPPFMMAMGLFLVAFGLFMFDVFGISIPASLTGGGSSGSGMAGSIGMGFLSALLSTPCSGAILAAVVVWAQTQPAAISLLAFVLMGAGMALPYLVIVLVPSLLNKLPRPGVWMEHVRKAMGFILLIIAVKMLSALPKERLVDVLYYAVVVSFALWMWGGWVNFATPAGRKWMVRLLAAVLAAGAGWMLLPVEKQLVDWQAYNAGVIQKAVEQKQPVVIKFTADWCTNCVFVDKKVYQNKAVADLMKAKGVLAIKADTTTDQMPATADLKNLYGESGTVPVSIVLLPDGSRLKLRGIFDSRQLMDALQALPTP